ncbi:MAG: substrate-binding domain-containing protein [Candidatus Latescibacterota bacterium]|nr:substrate-binding domain-containing protein [Candidatus Latescibacterota bacterium]
MNLVKYLLLLMIFSIACSGPQDDSDRLKIGYVVNFKSHEWYQNICRAAEKHAEKMGVDLIIADANNDVAAQISKAENLLAQGVDVLVLTPVDAKAMGTIVSQAKESGVRVITESNPVPGSDTYVGIDNEASGFKAGTWFAEYANSHNISPKVLIIGFPNFDDCRKRVEGFKRGLIESGMSYEIIQEVDGQGLKEKAFKVAQDALTANPNINAIFGINDDSVSGGISAYKAANLNEKNLTAIGFGFEGTVGQTALMGDTPYRSALAMFPDFVGVSLVDASIELFANKKLPDHYETPTIMITRENVDRFYDAKTDTFTMDLDAVRALLQ